MNGYVQQKLNFRSYAFPKIGSTLLTYFEEGGMELYVQKDTGRYEATMQAVKWLSDNSFLWTTKGRGASPRKSIQNSPDYKTAGLPWDVRGAFVEGMSFATLNRARSRSWRRRISPSTPATISWPRLWTRCGPTRSHRRCDDDRSRRSGRRISTKAELQHRARPDGAADRGGRPY